MNSRYIPKKAHGAILMATALAVLGATSLFTFYSVGSGISAERALMSGFKNQEAFEAAEAGLDYGIAYLQKNFTTILTDSNSDGTIDANSLTETLPNGGSFTISYTNPISGDTSLLRITSTGIAPNDTAQKQMTLLTKIQPGDTVYIPNVALTVQGDLNTSGSANITNTEGDTAIWAGGESSVNGEDVNENDSNLANATSEDFFENFFGMSRAQMRSRVPTSGDITYNNSVSTDYTDDLNGITGQTILITQTGGSTATISGGTVGSAESPVTLIVDGNLTITSNAIVYGTIYVTNGTFSVGGNAEVYGSVYVFDGNLDITGNGYVDGNVIIVNGSASVDTELAGNTTIHGLLYVDGDTAFAGNADTTGSVIVNGSLTMSGNATITYDSSAIDDLTSVTTSEHFEKVLGSWSDL